MRARHAEKIRSRQLVRDLAQAARAARLAMDVGDEAVAFLPDGRMAHMRLEGEDYFRVREVLHEDGVERIAARWVDEGRETEAVQ